MEEIQEIKDLLDKLEANYTAEHTSKIKHNLLLREINSIINMTFLIDNLDEINYILNVISDILLVDVYDMKGKSRKKDVVFARHLFFYFISSNYEIGQETLGKILNKDHATVYYAVKTVTEQKYRFIRAITEVSQIIKIKLKIKN